jgi:hypothetical protein
MKVYSPTGIVTFVLLIRTTLFVVLIHMYVVVTLELPPSTLQYTSVSFSTGPPANSVPLDSVNFTARGQYSTLYAEDVAVLE